MIHNKRLSVVAGFVCGLAFNLTCYAAPIHIYSIDMNKLSTSKPRIPELGDTNYYLYTAIKHNSLKLNQKTRIVSYQSDPKISDKLVRADGQEEIVANDKDIKAFLKSSYEEAKRKNQPVCDYSVPKNTTLDNFMPRLKKADRSYICVKRWYYNKKHHEFYGTVVSYSKKFFSKEHHSFFKDTSPYFNSSRAFVVG